MLPISYHKVGEYVKLNHNHLVTRAGCCLGYVGKTCQMCSKIPQCLQSVLI